MGTSFGLTPVLMLLIDSDQDIARSQVEDSGFMIAYYGAAMNIWT